MVFIAHKRENGDIQTLKEHSQNSAILCENFATAPFKSLAYLCGLLHDLGKYQKDFQARINGKNIRVEHSICGAQCAREKYAQNPVGSLIAQYAIAGHHGGIPNGGFVSDTPDDSSLQARLKRKMQDYSFYEFDLPNLDDSELAKFIQETPDREIVIRKFAFFTRYIFSCLVDADSTDTAQFCSGTNPQSLKSDFEKCLEKINANLKSKSQNTNLQKARSKIQSEVFTNSQNSQIYLLNMPTGSGKTLTSMKFALQKAINLGKKRIIYVIPYNSIIDQTYAEFERIFGESAQILRHQSTFDYDEASADEDYANIAKNASENYDADIIITTSVQFFESLYSNKRSKLRKIHNFADSVLIFDEAHLMPRQYLQPCLEGVVFLSKYLNSTTLFLTATMPNFRDLITEFVKTDIKIRDLISDKSEFGAFKKCEFENLGSKSMENIINLALNHQNSLIVVNSRKSAKEFYKIAKNIKNFRIFHLSTYMTPSDRKRNIDEIRKALNLNQKIIVISTSLIEAGVDLDFGAVFRELSGLDNILQAGGRCNREGLRDKRESKTYIFELENAKFSLINAEITRGLLEKYSDILEPKCISEYYEKLFFMEKDKVMKNMICADCSNLLNIKFKDYAENFNIIDSDDISIIAPCDENRDLIEKLKFQISSSLMRKLQIYAFSVKIYEFQTLQSLNALENINGIWVLKNENLYDKNAGISFETKDFIID
ncbi:CRISPR-associated helicase Cas3' [Campylobacter sp. VBCF_05 NA6]|uniref:CRISPR-associated helicase Cas3' n=1 Tax=unclassified Campylobacter TaxID=2593542 RepID=UPI0022E9B15D|nr:MULTISPECIES: CRISPR-associated helicase Cas3' [unclassified Campylobacter]MDA3057603.1 CRISPR-associated helicase Cas3' [Campylobacter sp. VBCF_04 NA7]MDA3058504.1 CRISPR-associated helicase Cas3' [Campylobacter sp. VBCF_05 NA6]